MLMANKKPCKSRVTRERLKTFSPPFFKEGGKGEGFEYRRKKGVIYFFAFVKSDSAIKESANAENIGKKAALFTSAIISPALNGRKNIM